MTITHTQFTSTITFSPVDTADPAMYTYTASVAPVASDSDDVMASEVGKDTVTIKVKLSQLTSHYYCFISFILIYYCRAHDINCE